MSQIEEFAEGHNLRARRIGQSPRFKQGTAECIAQSEANPLASRRNSMASRYRISSLAVR